MIDRHDDTPTIIMPVMYHHAGQSSIYLLLTSSSGNSNPAPDGLKLTGSCVCVCDRALRTDPAQVVQDASLQQVRERKPRRVLCGGRQHRRTQTHSVRFSVTVSSYHPPLCLSVCPTRPYVTYSQLPIMYRNGCTDRAGFFALAYTGFPIRCVRLTEISSCIFKIRAPPWNFVPISGFRKKIWQRHAIRCYR